MKIFEYTEKHLDMDKFRCEGIAEFVEIAKWSVIPTALHNDKIIIHKVTPAHMKSDITYKVIKVEDCSDHVYKVLKTKIKAIGGAEGLVDWMIKNADTFDCRITQILNYAWNEMKYEYL